MPPSRMRCWLIGADSLLAECGDILLRAGHELHGVVTSSARIGEWARARHVAVLASPEELLAAPRAAFDHLFAITHLAVLPEAVLALPERGAINFHDGPLPDYAGLNAPAWALMNGESRYGVTWHRACARVDAGDVLKQRTFDVAQDETAFSLNAKCFGAAIDSFAELVGELATDSAQPLPQDLARRRYFARHRRPGTAGVIDWTRPATELAALVRALDFGRYPNDLGSAKIVSGCEVVLVLRAFARDVSTDAIPGTVIEIDEQAIHVATGRGVLALTALAETSGRALPLREASRRLGLAPGAALDRLTPERAQRLHELDQRMSRDEHFWIDRLARLDPVTLPFAVRARSSLRPASAVAVPVAVPTIERDGERTIDAPTQVFAAWCGYLARLARRDVFDIGVRDDALRAATAELEGFVGAHVPVRIEVDRSTTFAALANRCAGALSEIDGRGPWICDVVSRQPRLAHWRDVPADELLPIAFERLARFGALQLQDGLQCALEVESESGACRFVYDAERVDHEIASSIASGFEALLASIAAAPELAVAEHAIACDDERARQLVEWNRTARPYDAATDVYTAFEAQSLRSPDAAALTCDGRTIDYSALRERAQSFAAELEQRGVRTGDLVGVSLERSIDMVVAVLAILKSGAAYVPLDPSFPAERSAFMVDDARLRLVVTQSHLDVAAPVSASPTVFIDALPRTERRGEPGSRARPDGVAYVIYTSGSTGRPKGVQVEHRQVASFFAAMDELVPHDEPGTWLAVTSLSFDISVLEILWTLARGFRVVIHNGVERRRASASGSTAAPESARALDFSLFYFASDEGATDGYRLLLEGARFADTHDFRAVWTPERHFHAFGGLFPNPAVTSAAIAAITKRVAIRAGSVVLPLHHPARVAEEWALVDNLSNGRAAISFATGWQPDDFVLAPTRAVAGDDAKHDLLRDIDLVRRLWRGETVSFPGPNGDVAVRTLPRPVQPELVYWITAAGNVDTFVTAGRAGANLLTHLLGQSVDELAAKVARYRAARAGAGHDPLTGVVTLMLHTFVGEDEAQVAASVRAPLERYLASSMSLLGRHAATFPAFRRASSPTSAGAEFTALDAEERAALLAHVSERYMESDGLFGTPERCLALAERVRAAGVDEIACLIDFGVAVDDVLASLPRLDRLRRMAQETARAPDAASLRDETVAALLRRERVTHLQCTPSLARILCDDPETRAALRGVQHVFVGGEALSAELARDLHAATDARITNMYGPTETTVWSTTHVLDVRERAPTVPIGRPLANTRAYVLDAGGRPLPIGACGELFLGGDGVTRGYLRRPELDLERFLADPFAETPHARMYRTGDLVRYRHDGVLEFLGRDDQQIKVRGHRIEPGEIENALLRESSIAECVVVAREDVPGDQRLVAYCVPRGAAPDASLLRRRLKAILPEYMVPSHVAFVGALPRTPNMKIDRRALPSPTASVASTAAASAARPANELESRLAALWQEILGVEQVGVDDNFFDLGGQSLLVVRIHRRMSELVPRPVSLTDLFRFPTIRSLACFLASDVASDAVDGAARRGEQRRLLRRRRQRVEEA
ncbi:MAG: MupA/Atu3671 family FMN-dependent luciferase-like monooxygenase [Planctomycetota bacterium]